MSDIMMFPKTVDEFMDMYKIVDSDEVYTNGAELVPIFRMKQWFEHVDVELVKHGQWYDEPNYLGTCRTMFFCSRCGSASFREDPYCWHCGAKMDEVKE